MECGWCNGIRRRAHIFPRRNELTQPLAVRDVPLDALLGHKPAFSQRLHEKVQTETAQLQARKLFAKDLP